MSLRLTNRLCGLFIPAVVFSCLCAEVTLCQTSFESKNENANTDQKIYEPGKNGVVPPQPLFTPQPANNAQVGGGKKTKYEGTSLVSLVVDEQGTPQSVHALTHLPYGLDDKAVEAVRQYRFKPATLRGKAVPVHVTIQVQFHIYKP